MKTPLSLGLMFAALCALPACSSDEGNDTRPNGGTGGTPTGAAGTGGASGGTGGSTSNAGAGGTGAGGTGSQSSYRSGTALTITPTAAGANVLDEAATSNTGISGGVILAQSTGMTVPAETAHVDGKLCMHGTTATVINDDYTTYWGAEMSMDLKLVPADGSAAPAADAGADAGAPVQLVRTAWDMGTVVGFSFVVTGNGAAGAGIPAPNEFRFKALPDGSDPSLDTFCSEPGPTSGNAVEVGFNEITFQCWNMGNPSLADATIPTIATAGATQTTRPNPKKLQTISWQVASTTTADIPFDFCVSDIKPLYAQ